MVHSNCEGHAVVFFFKKRFRFMLGTLKVGRISLTRILHCATHISIVDEDVKERTVENPTLQ